MFSILRVVQQSGFHRNRLASGCRTALVLLFVCSASLAQAQQLVDRVYKDAAGEHRYEVYLPPGYSADRPTPAILFLHGAGECGTDGRKPAMVGLGPYAKAWGPRFPFVVVFPQVETMQGRMLTRWQAGSPDAERAMKILDEAQAQFAIDKNRTALVGWSMGGYGAWSLGAEYPDRWSAVVVLSGGGDPQKVAALKDTPVWAFHGAQDSLVPVSAEKAMVDALREAGGKVTFTEFPQGGHDIFAQSFGNEGLVKWLQNPQQAPAELSPIPATLHVDPPPFVPALDIPQAAGIRLGNDFLSALSYGVPSQIPASMLTGRLNDMFDGTVVRGRSFSIRFSGISYTGQLERVQIQATGDDRVTVQLGLRNIVLSIGGTSVSGARHSAYAGPIAIGIGHNRAVWLTIDVAPYVADQQLKLRLLGSSFSIPPDSYYVTQPAGVSVQGFGMTQEAVVNGLVSGLYGARGRVENEVRAVVPNIVQELERQLTLTDPGPMVSSMWPLPVYPPRVRGYPQEVRTDREGISVIMGLTAANYDLAAPQGTVKTAAIKGVSLDQLQGKALGVAVAPQMLEPMSQLLIDAKLARISLLDLPEPSFHRLSQLETLTEILPDLKRFNGDVAVRSDLVFSAPLTIGIEQGAAGKEKDGNAADVDNQADLKLGLPQSGVEVWVQTPAGTGDWQKYAVFDLAIQDGVLAKLERPTHSRRLLELNWDQHGMVTGSGRYVAEGTEGEAGINSERFVALFQESWQAWTRQGPAGATVIPDVQFGGTRLRINDLTVDGSSLETEFDVPTIKLTNLSEEPFRYQTRGPYSQWSETWTLEPGKSQEYQIPYPLTYRRVGEGPQEEYTLYTGTHSEYRVPVAGGPPRLFNARQP